MAIASVSASSAALSWNGAYDDVAHTVVLSASGPGRSTIILEQSDGKRAAVQFVQQSGPLSTPIPVPAAVVPTLAIAPVVVTIPPGTQQFNGITLKPIPPGKPGGEGSFVLVGAETNMS